MGVVLYPLITPGTHCNTPFGKQKGRGYSLHPAFHYTTLYRLRGCWRRAPFDQPLRNTPKSPSFLDECTPPNPSFPPRGTHFLSQFVAAVVVRRDEGLWRFGCFSI
ncbi:hypothetical protein RHMOL_Rhmol03G0208200 [Rhododendron molle]|uniref:Uncharacterized protein n=1 Tax=Rhododendron molle TaxID=49168 RepID=A0ACC0PI55_RHOML|nr:hypothetical protein RHMOL_Rhmol03G0208200 [Rhododendron molle]